MLGNGFTIRIGWEIQCLPYAKFVLLVLKSTHAKRFSASHMQDLFVGFCHPPCLECLLIFAVIIFFLFRDKFLVLHPDFLNVTKFTPASFQTKNFTSKKSVKPLINTSFQYILPKSNWPTTPL